MGGECSAINGSFATTLTSYSPALEPDKPTVTAERLALVIPALHEAENLGPLLRRVRQVLDSAGIDWELIVVDDSSHDGTEEIVGAMVREDPRVRLLVRSGERGLAGAILHGWRHSGAGILGVMDADGQHPAEILPRLLATIASGCDLAVASRYAEGSRRSCAPRRRMMSLVALLAARPLQPLHPRVRDPLSGFFLVRRHCVENVSFQTAGFKLLLEILVRGRVASVGEIPFAFGRRRAGRSKVNLRVAWEYMVLLVRLYRTRLFMARLPQAASGD
jgi:dolichol-phosphate mannosyltransferase